MWFRKKNKMMFMETLSDIKMNFEGFAPPPKKITYTAIGGEIISKWISWSSAPGKHVSYRHPFIRRRITRVGNLVSVRNSTSESNRNMSWVFLSRFLSTSLCNLYLEKVVLLPKHFCSKVILLFQLFFPRKYKTTVLLPW